MLMYRRIIRSDAEFFRNHDAEVINSVYWRTCARGDLLVRSPHQDAVNGRLYSRFWRLHVYTNWFFALCLIPLCFLSGYFLIFDKRLQTTNRASRSAWDQVRVQAKEYVGSVEEIRPNNAFGYGLRLLDRAFQRYHDTMDEVSRLRCLFNVASPIVATIQDSALYWIGAALCLLTLKSASLFWFRSPGAMS